MPHVTGSKNYKKHALSRVVDEVLPTGPYAWQQVANLYKEQSGENTLRDPLDVKRHWTEKLCFKFKKPTSNGGPAHDFILRCQRVHTKIMKKCKTSLMGGESSGDEDKSDHESEGEEDNDTEQRNASTMDWLGDDKSVNGDGEVEGVVPALPPINGADEEVEINEDENQNGGGTEGSESGTQTDQQSVVQMVASMNVSNRLTGLIDSLPMSLILRVVMI